MAIKTFFGWVLSGTVRQNGRRHRAASCVSSVLASNENLENSGGIKSMTVSRFRPLDHLSRERENLRVYERPIPRLVAWPRKVSCLYCTVLFVKAVGLLASGMFAPRLNLIIECTNYRANMNAGAFETPRQSIVCPTN